MFVVISFTGLDLTHALLFVVFNKLYITMETIISAFLIKLILII